MFIFIVHMMIGSRGMFVSVAFLCWLYFCFLYRSFYTSTKRFCFHGCPFLHALYNKRWPLCVNPNVSGTVRNKFFCAGVRLLLPPTEMRHKTRWSPLLPLSVYEEAQQLFSPCPSRRRFYISMKSPRVFCIVHMPPLPLDSPGVVI